MRRSTISLLASAAILAVGSFLVWAFIVAPRLKPAPVPAPAPAAPTPLKAEEERHGALNLYLAAPENLPSGVTRAELTLIKATLADADGAESPVFSGVQRVMLQSGSAEKALSELVANGSWSRLKLEFSPAAELSMADGSTVAAVLEQRQAVLSFQADLPVSRTLALFARVPLETGLKKAGDTWTADLSPDPQAAERYVFGSFMLDPRGKNGVWTLPHLSLADVVKADLGLDITAVLPGSKGFNPADQAPSGQPPQQ